MELIIEADTVESAIYEGLKKINRNRNDVRISVLDKGDKDFLGLTGSKKAKVRIEYEDNNRRPPSEQQTKSEERTDRSKDRKIEREKEKEKEPRKNFTQEEENHSDRIINPEDLTIACSLLQEWFDKMKFEETQVKPETFNGSVLLQVISKDSSLIIGKNGKTLNALQLLMNTVINKDRKDDEKLKVIIDTENYREKRIEALHKMAENYVSKLHRIKKDVYLPPLNNTERKIIHNYLSKLRGVSSISVGEEPMRKIKLTMSRSGKE